MAQVLKKADVATHNSANDLWIIVDEDVYDLTTFQDEHPGLLLFSHALELILMWIAYRWQEE